jgi:hypothetical protein
VKEEGKKDDKEKLKGIWMDNIIRKMLDKW